MAKVPLLSPKKGVAELKTELEVQTSEGSRYVIFMAHRFLGAVQVDSCGIASQLVHSSTIKPRVPQIPTFPQEKCRFLCETVSTWHAIKKQQQLH